MMSLLKIMSTSYIANLVYYQRVMNENLQIINDCLRVIVNNGMNNYLTEEQVRGINETIDAMDGVVEEITYILNFIQYHHHI